MSVLLEGTISNPDSSSTDGKFHLWSGHWHFAKDSNSLDFRYKVNLQFIYPICYSFHLFVFVFLVL